MAVDMGSLFPGRFVLQIMRVKTIRKPFKFRFHSIN